MKPMITFIQAIARAEKLEQAADRLTPCDSNMVRHATLIARAMELRELAESIAKQETPDTANAGRGDQ